MDNKETIDLKVVSRFICDRLFDIQEEDLSNIEQAVVHGAVFFLLMNKYPHEKREQIVNLAQGRATAIFEELKNLEKDHTKPADGPLEEVEEVEEEDPEQQEDEWDVILRDMESRKWDDGDPDPETRTFEDEDDKDE